ncbi:MAG TPA: hypothetical protein VJ829_14785 [Candidatus Binatia bacterium]|nr:hypothetical protein [Candidatus Binatia bacterium]
MLRHVTSWFVVLALVGCSSTVKSPRAQTVESELASSGFRMVVPDTPQKQELVKRLPKRKLTEGMRNGKRYYWFADPDGCGCVYVGGEAAYRRYDQLAQARDNLKSDRSDVNSLRTVESEEESPPDAWFWQDQLPEYFPQ